MIPYALGADYPHCRCAYFSLGVCIVRARGGDSPHAQQKQSRAIRFHPFRPWFENNLFFCEKSGGNVWWCRENFVPL